MRSNLSYALIALLAFAALAALSTLGAPPDRASTDAERRDLAAERQTTKWERQREAARERADGWLFVDGLEHGAELAEEARDAVYEREVSAVALAFSNAARTGRPSRLAEPTFQVQRFRQWARSLPPQVRLGDTDVFLHSDRDSASIDVTWELPTRGYTRPGQPRRPHVLDTSVEFELVRRGASWRVVEVYRESTGLAALSSPIVVRDGAITVVADAAQRELARDVAGIATKASRGIASQLPGIAVRGPVTIYLARSGGASERIMERPAAAHASAWVNEDADVVILSTHAHRGPLDATLVDLVWHEMAHVLISPIDRKLPAILNEGVAEHIGAQAALSIPNIYLNYSSRADEVLGGRYPYAKMLSGTSDYEFYDGDVSREAGYHLGLATIEWIKAERGDATLRRFLRVAGRSGGTVAARSVLKLSPAQLHEHARDWVRGHRQLY